MSTAVIVNPRAGGGRVGRRWPAIEREVRSALGEITTYFTRGPGDGVGQCRAALAAGARLVVAAGGDGTSSEVAAGLIGAGAGPASGIAFAYLPCGTGRDLRRTLGSPEAIGAAARAIAAATPRPIDAGQIDHVAHDGGSARCHFINAAGFGITGLGDQMVNRSQKWLGAKATYFGAAVRASLIHKNADVGLRIDDQPERRCVVYNLAVANGRFFGGGMKIAPEALVDDGLFDVITMGDLSFFAALRLSARIYQGRHIGQPRVEHTRARTLTARPLADDAIVYIDADGENPGRLPATFTLLPAAILLKV